MALANLQIKVYPETEAEFNSLMAESDCNTKGKFLELLIENFKNPKVKTVLQDTPETANRLKDLQQENNGLKSDLEAADHREGLSANELTAFRDTFKQIDTIFKPYLIICKRLKTANDYPGLFKFMLDKLQKGGAFILDQEDIAYIKSNQE